MGTSFAGHPELPRGLRDNNVGNIRPSTKYKWLGQIEIENNYVIFVDIEHGIRAMAIDLRSKINRGLNTLNLYIPVYSPNGDGPNDENAYIKAVSNSTGINPDQPLVADAATLTKLVKAHIQVELGIKKAFLITDDIIKAGIALV